MEKSTIVNILKIIEDLSHIKDIDTLLENVLLETRKITNADAGSVFLKEDDCLTFEYVQNDTLDALKKRNRYEYDQKKISINNKSISGYVATTKKSLLINDVYKLDNNIPYSFNRKFDRLSSYRTKSILTVPLVTSRDKTIGVIQIINRMDKNRNILSFSKDDEFLVNLFAKQAAVAIEKAIMTREIILRMISIAELRDPLETGAHVNRVGAFSVELYITWAQNMKISASEIKKNKDILRISAMLHDVGKVAIGDSILKKTGKLSSKEFDTMKLHTVFGARLFKNSKSEWDDMAATIALNHHEKWDGTGYPGKIENIFSDDLVINRGKKREEIPIYARIVSISDVFDALLSERIYKNSWPKKKVESLIKSERGKHFDPVLVDIFLDIKDTFYSIWEKYS